MEDMRPALGGRLRVPHAIYGMIPDICRKCTNYGEAHKLTCTTLLLPKGYSAKADREPDRPRH